MRGVRGQRGRRRRAVQPPLRAEVGWKPCSDFDAGLVGSLYAHRKRTCTARASAQCGRPDPPRDADRSRRPTAFVAPAAGGGRGPLLVLEHVGQLAATSARVVLRHRAALYAGGLPQRSQSDRCSHPVMWLVCAHGAETATEGRHRRCSDSCGRRVARHRGLCFECRVGSIAAQDISETEGRTGRVRPGDRS